VVRRQLLDRLNDIPGISFHEGVLNTRARIPTKTLTSSAAMEKLKAAVAWLIAQIRTECEEGPSGG